MPFHAPAQQSGKNAMSHHSGPGLPRTWFLGRCTHTPARVGISIPATMQHHRKLSCLNSNRKLRQVRRKAKLIWTLPDRELSYQFPRTQLSGLGSFEYQAAYETDSQTLFPHTCSKKRAFSVFEQNLVL